MFGPSNRQYRRRFSQPIPLENREPEPLKILLHLVIQCRTSADEVTDAPAHAFVNRIEDELAQV